MIKIEIDAASGAEARAELLNLLGIGQTNWIGIDPAAPGKDVSIKATIGCEGVEKIEVIEPAKTEESVKGKRRTKAEIAANNAAQETETEKPNEEEISDQAQTMLQDNADQNKEIFPELVDLQRACAIIVRAGYKQKGIDIIKNIGKADTSKDVAPELRQACIDELNAFADENKIAR